MIPCHILKVLVRKNNLFPRADFQEVFDPPHYELFNLRDKVSFIAFTHYIIGTCLYRFKTTNLLMLSFTGDFFKRPWGVVRGAPVPTSAQEVLVRIALHTRTPLWLSGLYQLH